MDTLDHSQRTTSTGLKKRCSRGVLILILPHVLILSYVTWKDRSFTFVGRYIPRPTFYDHLTQSNGTNKTIYVSSEHRNEINTSNIKLGNPQSLTVVGSGQFFIYTVVAEQSLSTLKWTALIFSGWEESYAMDTDYRCCFLFQDGSASSKVTKAKRRMWTKSPNTARNMMKDSPIIASQITCTLNERVPVLAGLVLANRSCNQDTVYLRPVYREQEKVSKFAICGRVVYGGKKARELVEWVEYHRYYGASAMLIYPYADLNQEAYRVLGYYAKEGFLEIVPLPFVPRRDVYKRQFHLASHIMDQDMQVTNFDAQERLRAYKYYTLIDTDEFIAPRTDITNFLQLMERLLRKDKMAASFKLLTEVHLHDWGMTGNSSDLIIAQHGYHTEPSELTQKILHVSERITPGKLWIHAAEPIKGFAEVTAKPSAVVLKHYRMCKQWWFRADKWNKPCIKHFQKIRGHFMENAAKLIRKKVLEVEMLLQLK